MGEPPEHLKLRLVRKSPGRIAAALEADEEGYVRLGPHERLLVSGLDWTKTLSTGHDEPHYGAPSEVVCGAAAARAFGVDEEIIEKNAVPGATFLRSLGIDPDEDDTR